MENQQRYTVASDGKGNWTSGQENPSLAIAPTKARERPALAKAQHPEDFGSLLDLIGDLKDKIFEQEEVIEAMREHLASLTELVHGKTEKPLTNNVEQLNLRDAA